MNHFKYIGFTQNMKFKKKIKIQYSINRKIKIKICIVWTNMTLFWVKILNIYV